MITLTGFADEIDPCFDTQLEVLREFGLSHLELRTADGVNAADFDAAKTQQVRQKLRQAGIRVSAIGSPIGKIPVTDPFTPHFKQFQRVVETAKALDTRFIRVFSFYIPEESAPGLHRDEVLFRLGQMIDYAAERDVILLHENEKGIYGDTASRCEDLMRTLGCPHFQFAFDFANFVQCNEDTKEAFQMLAPYIAYIHVKDALAEGGSVVPAGMGNGQVSRLLSELKGRGYEGFLSIEPHLFDFAALASLEAHPEQHSGYPDGKTAWRAALDALTDILRSLDWEAAT